MSTTQPLFHEVPSSPQEPAIEVVWATPSLPSLTCSHNLCVNGHKWPLLTQLLSCPACSTPILAIKMSSCPFCNEPSSSVSLTAVLAPSMSLNPPCATKESPLAQEAFTVPIRIPRDFSNLPPRTELLARKAGEAAGLTCPTCASRKESRNA